MFRVLYSYFKVKKQSINSNISDALIDSLPKGTTVETVVCLSKDAYGHYFKNRSVADIMYEYGDQRDEWK